MASPWKKSDLRWYWSYVRGLVQHVSEYVHSKAARKIVDALFTDDSFEAVYKVLEARGDAVNDETPSGDPDPADVTPTPAPDVTG